MQELGGELGDFAARAQELEAASCTVSWLADVTETDKPLPLGLQLGTVSRTFSRFSEQGIFEAGLRHVRIANQQACN